ncbi:MAG: asparagine synthase (glutamine-hydrolyzing) [Nitrospinota bacterium]
MCGICGFAGFDDEQLLRRMTSSLVHRGPDEEGFFLARGNEQSAGGIGLGIRRLKIIDLQTGSQPIYNEDGDIVIVYNGEIYNYKELKAKSEKKGHKFRSETDTEVIVHLYEDYGAECVKYFHGMFAFAIWDSKRKQLFLARDQIGIKPLYYTELNGRIIFASELKSILQCKEVPSQINLRALDLYLTHLYIPAPLTIFERIYKLLPGHYLIWENGKTKIEKYWDLEVQSKVQDLDEQSYIEKLQYLLREAVKSHLVSDVPLGAFLSGGLDSSTVVAMMSEVSNQPVKTFTIGYGKKDESFNEFKKARLVAKKNGCEHHEYILEPRVIELLPELVKYFDEPFADSSMIPTYLISKVSREKVTVALTGIGGDELFGGYPRYLGAKISLFYEKSPLFFRQIASLIGKNLPETGGSRDWSGRIRRFLIAGTMPFSERYKNWVSFFDSELKDKLYTEDFRFRVKSPKSELDYYFSLLDEKILEKIFYVDLKTYLVDDLLCMADRMSMANSLELRVPLCDLNLIEFLARTPFSLKVHGFTFKYLLKRAMAEILPEEILQQKKMGFMIPLNRWISEEMNPLIEEYLSEDTIKKRGYFKPEGIRWLLEQHRLRKRNFADQIYTLLILEVWQRSYEHA